MYNLYLRANITLSYLLELSFLSRLNENCEQKGYPAILERKIFPLHRKMLTRMRIENRSMKEDGYETRIGDRNSRT